MCVQRGEHGVLETSRESAQRPCWVFRIKDCSVAGLEGLHRAQVLRGKMLSAHSCRGTTEPRGIYPVTKSWQMLCFCGAPEMWSLLNRKYKAAACLFMLLILILRKTHQELVITGHKIVNYRSLKRIFFQERQLHGICIIALFGAPLNGGCKFRPSTWRC